MKVLPETFRLKMITQQDFIIKVSSINLYFVLTRPVSVIQYQ